MVSTISNTAGSAQLLWNQLYGSYGEKRYSAGTVDTAKGFTGQYSDDLTGLDYYMARYYDPVIGRFLSADTVQDNWEGMDPYAYVSGNPETETDPTGHWGWGETLAVVAALVLVAAVAVIAAPVVIGTVAAIAGADLAVGAILGASAWMGVGALEGATTSIAADATAIEVDHKDPSPSFTSHLEKGNT